MNITIFEMRPSDDPLNNSVVGGKSFCSMVTVCDDFPRIVFSLVKQKVSQGQLQEQVFVTIGITVPS